jgi:hypothetical protein
MARSRGLGDVYKRQLEDKVAEMSQETKAKFSK